MFIPLKMVLIGIYSYPYKGGKAPTKPHTIPRTIDHCLEVRRAFKTLVEASLRTWGERGAGVSSALLAC